jgi:chromosome segregation ATPase
MIKRLYIDTVVIVVCLLLFVQCANHAKLRDEIEALKRELKVVNPPPTQSDLAEQIQEVNAATQSKLEQQIQVVTTEAQEKLEQQVQQREDDNKAAQSRLENIEEGTKETLMRLRELTVEVSRALGIISSKLTQEFAAKVEVDNQEKELLGKLDWHIDAIASKSEDFETIASEFFKFDVIEAQQCQPPDEVGIPTTDTTSSSTHNSTYSCH